MSDLLVSILYFTENEIKIGSGSELISKYS